jgi:nicotinamide-nucleotide amidase
MVSMPGVPREMTRMWREQVVPRIQSRLPARVIRTTTYRTIGIGESAAEQTLSDLVQITNPSVATYAKDDGVHIRVTGIAETEIEADLLRAGAAAVVEERLGRYIYGTDDTSLPGALLSLLRERELTIGVADRGGGGRFASLLLSEPLAGETVIGTSAGPSSEVAAADLAAEVLRLTSARVGIGIAVESQPAPPVYEGRVSVAVVGAVSGEEVFPMRSAYEEIQRRSGMNVSDVLRRAILGLG